MRKLPLLMLFPAFLACAGALRAQEPKEKKWKDWIHRPLTDDEKEQIRDRATLNLYDPFSVRFRWSRVHLVEHKGQNRVGYSFQTCVWLNAKNLNGAYTGFKPVEVLFIPLKDNTFLPFVVPVSPNRSENSENSTEKKCREIGMSIHYTELEPPRDR
jgi:hypothetical protein